jgi:hypothetical protein
MPEFTFMFKLIFRLDAILSKDCAIESKTFAIPSNSAAPPSKHESADAVTLAPRVGHGHCDPPGRLTADQTTCARS